MENTNDCVKKDYDKTLEKYNYCKSERIKNNENENEFYHKIIKNYINKSDVVIEKDRVKNSEKEEIDYELMELLNWIALWKTNRIIELNNDDNLRDLLKELHKIKEDGKDNTKIGEVLKSLLESKKGIDLPMASTIMHFFNPELCPIIDRRADRIIFSEWKKLKADDYTIDDPRNGDINSLRGIRDIDWKIRYYLFYQKRCKDFCKDNNDKGAEMESIDRFLYQKDKDLIKGLGKYQIGQWLDNK